jgi:cell division protein FtsB
VQLLKSWLFIFSLVVLGVGLAHLVKGIQGWQEAREKEKQYIADLKQLESKRDELKTQLEKIKTNPLAKERLVRKKLGFVKPGETVYKIVRPDEKKRVGHATPRNVGWNRIATHRLEDLE